MRIILELFRITTIFIILGALMGGLIKLIYAGLRVDIDYTKGAWLVGFSILLLLYVLYKNKLQFSGFYKGEGKLKLTKSITVFLICCSILLLILAPFIK